MEVGLLEQPPVPLLPHAVTAGAVLVGFQSRALALLCCMHSVHEFSAVLCSLSTLRLKE